MAKFHIKKDDQVIVLAGVDKDKTREVPKVITDKERVIVESANMVLKSTKSSAANSQGGIVKQEAVIHISNLSLIDPKGGKAACIKIEREGKAAKRTVKKSGEETK